MNGLERAGQMADDSRDDWDGSSDPNEPGGEGRARRDRTAARMDDLSRLLSGWLWETDRDLRLTHVGARILDVLQYHPSEFVGRPAADLFGSDVPLAPGRKGAPARPFRDKEVAAVARDGSERTLWLAAVPVFADRSGRFTGYRGLARDVTASKAQERALQEAKAAAERANKAKSEFLATMSHEFRTPLNAVIGFADVINGAYFGPLGNAKYSEYAADIAASARHLAQMIDDILDMSKIEAGRMELQEERVEPGELIERAARMVRPRAESAGHAFRVTCPPDRVELRVDPHKLVQVLINLLANAVKFTGAGGRIDLAAGLAPDGALAFKVSDNGVGMSADEQAIALQPFRQAHAASAAARQGSGLGLSIVKALAELHGGELSVDSAPGAGTTVTVTVPPDRVATVA
jgi:signal transduction histidine kinase